MARSHGMQKFSTRSMNVVQQIAEREGRRVCLEEILPGLIIVLIFFPVNKRDCKWYVLRTMKKNMLPCMFYIWSAVVAVGWECAVKALSIFTRRGVSCGPLPLRSHISHAHPTFPCITITATYMYLTKGWCFEYIGLTF